MKTQNFYKQQLEAYQVKIVALEQKIKNTKDLSVKEKLKDGLAKHRSTMASLEKTLQSRKQEDDENKEAVGA